MYFQLTKDDPDQRFGRITRRLTFDNLYVSKEDVLKNDNPIGSADGPDIKVSNFDLCTGLTVIVTKTRPQKCCDQSLK